MKHNQNNRRQRPRGNGRRYPNQKGGSFESTGPEAKVRGTAQQVLEKYQALARDAYSAGDRILAEGYLQHAEHYYRIISLENESAGRDNNRPRQNNANSDDDMDNDDQNDDENHNDQNDHRDGQRGNGSSRGHAQQSGGNQPAHREDVPIKSGNEAVEVTETPAQSVDTASGDVAPRKPRTRRPRKTEQPPAETPESSAAD
ncbi:MAG: DUF4167 domain-containing protein [Rhodospirillales bacterium]